MVTMREQIIEQCIEILNRDNVKRELKEVLKPIISLILQEIYPYIYLSMIFVIISFLLVLGTFYLSLRTLKYLKYSSY